MNGVDNAALRDRNGRFMPGCSGNPAGKRPGTRNRATVLDEMLRDGEAVAAVRLLIDKALAGDAVTLRFLVGRLIAPPRGRPIELDLPEGARAHDIVAAFDATVRAMAAGEITPDEAVRVTSVLDGRRKAIEAASREEARDERTRSLKPSPSGRGPSISAQEGEGFGPGFDVAGKAASNRPRPDTLPQGEGIPSIAAAMDPSHAHKGRAAVRRDHLHSTCILQPWAARAAVGPGDPYDVLRTRRAA